MPRHALMAAVIGLAATLLALGVATLGGAGATALEWSVYDRGVRARAAAPVSPALLVVARDPASEARFGAGSWDRAVLARLITSLSRAGAAAIGFDVPLGQPSAPGRGGASSDALLSQATALTNAVVYPISLELTHAAPVDGHLAAHRSWLPVARIPLDGRGRALVSYAAPQRLNLVSFLDIWTAIDERRVETLQRLVDGKIVLVLAEPARGQYRTPVGPMSDVLIQAQLLNAVLAGSWLREAPLGWTLLGALVVAGLTAWLCLALSWWKALGGVAVLTTVYIAALLLSPSLIGVLLPAVLPLGAVVVACAGALGWNQLGSAYRLRHLEGEVGKIREALVGQESTVEALEEDLEAARAAVARSSGAERELLQTAEALRRQLGEARAQEEQTRGQLRDLERELRAADTRQVQLDDADQERLRRQCAEVGIITRDPGVLALFRDLEKAARASLPILILGEPGTGKELFARAAHRLSPRAGGPFVAVNMAAIPPELFESELFGHVKGSFTGAVAEHRGYFEQADRGTIFLDEVGELRAEHQSKLLRVLQDKTFYRVGATRSTAVDVRVVAASNRDLERGIAEGWFREDLYFRLKGLVLRLPPLRERRQDVGPLAARFLEEATAEAARRVTLSEAALLALERHEWPGNVPELQHCLRQAVALADRAVLAPEDLRLSPAGDARSDAARDATGSGERPVGEECRARWAP